MHREFISENKRIALGNLVVDYFMTPKLNASESGVKMHVVGSEAMEHTANMSMCAEIPYVPYIRTHHDDVP